MKFSLHYNIIHVAGIMRLYNGIYDVLFFFKKKCNLQIFKLMVYLHISIHVFKTCLSPSNKVLNVVSLYCMPCMQLSIFSGCGSFANALRMCLLVNGVFWNMYTKSKGLHHYSQQVIFEMWSKTKQNKQTKQNNLFTLSHISTHMQPP